MDISILRIQITFEFSTLKYHHDSENKTRLCWSQKEIPLMGLSFSSIIALSCVVEITQ